MHFRLPIPYSWQDFESICLGLWKDIWSDPNAQKNGRIGQPQHGVDVFGRPIYESGYAGVQCKDKDSRLGSVLAEGDLVAECEKAGSFTPVLDSFTIATTAPRDQSIQMAARRLNAESAYRFDVHVWSWDDIEAEVVCRPQLLHAFYANLNIAEQPPNRVKLSASAPREQLFAFFGRPLVTDALHQTLRTRLVQVVYELSDNAFVHGRASRFELSFDGNVAEIRDDGSGFNPLTDLDAGKVSVRSHVGSYVMNLFRTSFGDSIQIEYSRITDSAKPLNSLTFNLAGAQKQNLDPEILDVPVDLNLAYGRNAARRLAQTITIPFGLKELVLTVNAVLNLSAFVEFVSAILSRLRPTTMLVISVPRSDFSEVSKFVRWFNDARLSVRSR